VFRLKEDLNTSPKFTISSQHSYKGENIDGKLLQLIKNFFITLRFITKGNGGIMDGLPFC